MGGQTDTIEARIGALATRQRGLVERWQLILLGLTARQIDRRIAAGLLVVVHRGVYAVGHGHLDREAGWLAAVLGAGPAAVLSHATAAAAWGLLPARAGAPHVVLPGVHGVRRPAGVVVHRSRTLAPGDVSERGPLRLTVPARTIEDCATARSPVRQLRRMVEQAEALGLLGRPLDTTRRPRLRTALDEGPPLARSELEERFLALVAAERLPRPMVNTPIGAYVVDFLWPDRGLAVETDGFAHHGGRDAFARDRARDRELALLGVHVVRFTYADVVHERERTATTLRGLLGRRSVSA